MLKEKKPTLILSFNSTTDAMATDRYCTKNGLPGRLIPVPREITAGCGFAWKAAPEDAAMLTAALKEAGISWASTYVLNI